MAEYYNEGECIDGKRVLLKAKKMVPYPAAYVTSPTGFKGIKYKCSRDGESEIKIALPEDNAKEAIERKPSVHLIQGDTLKCNKYFFIAETRKKLTCFDVAMMSGRHECSEGQPDVRVYAEIESPFESIVHATKKRMFEIDKRKRLSSAPLTMGIDSIDSML